MQFPQYSADATKRKCQRIGLEVVVRNPRITKTTTSEPEISKELPTVEKPMKIFAGPFETAARADKLVKSIVATD